ncbi:hypothetical protein AVEN_7328-1 [Araneus ventricosus]|uniref:Uncharacterized protein n=1 Tax=Araneus ventricosus TaxID=182803 RepID=A0A4Y2BSQ5_ARAVE|nr:hypothetical protein AVEN_7328-1 [Araneus ventricosus]
MRWEGVHPHRGSEWQVKAAAGEVIPPRARKRKQESSGGVERTRVPMPSSLPWSRPKSHTFRTGRLSAGILSRSGACLEEGNVFGRKLWTRRGHWSIF